MRPIKASAVSENLKARRSRVVVADDDRTVRSVIARILEAKGYQAIAVDGGDACLKAAEENNIDAFVVDLYMPGIDGLQLCRTLRSIEHYKHVPILCMTAAGETGHVNAAFEAGADDFIAKPVNPSVLDARLRGQIERSESMAEMRRLRENLDRYVSRRTREVVCEYTISGTLPGPQEADICVLFSDIRGFTQMSHELDAQALFAALSENLGMQVDCVDHFGGYVDKFAGDGIMAVFEDIDGAEQASRCALEILRQTRESANYRSETPLRLGIGIHCGHALVGNVGSARHLDYSVVGKTVNLAARLCGAAAPMTAVVSTDVVQSVGRVHELRFTAPCAINVRGVRDPVSVYQLERAPLAQTISRRSA